MSLTLNQYATFETSHSLPFVLVTGVTHNTLVAEKNRCYFLNFEISGAFTIVLPPVSNDDGLAYNITFIIQTGIEFNSISFTNAPDEPSFYPNFPEIGKDAFYEINALGFGDNHWILSGVELSYL